MLRRIVAGIAAAGFVVLLAFLALAWRPAITPLAVPPPPANTIPFPLNIRAFQEGWKLLFFTSGRYRPDPSKSATWNRGAYLAEGLSHCGGCHTPRNLLGAEKAADPYAGGVADDWIAPALTDANPSPVPWTESELFSYLRSGVSPLHSLSAGPMSPRLPPGPSALPDADIRAQSVYFADLDHADAHMAAIDVAVTKALATSSLGNSQEDDTEPPPYDAALLACHYNAAATPPPARPALA